MVIAVVASLHPFSEFSRAKKGSVPGQFAAVVGKVNTETERDTRGHPR